MSFSLRGGADECAERLSGMFVAECFLDAAFEVGGCVLGDCAHVNGVAPSQAEIGGDIPERPQYLLEVVIEGVVVLVETIPHG